MNYRDLNAVINATGMSAEQLSPVFGVGNMTIRRWQKAKPSGKVPKTHQWNIIQSVYQLVLDSKLSTDTPAVQSLLKGSTPASFQAVLKDMGAGEMGLVGDTANRSSVNHQDTMMTMLSQIGGSNEHQNEVNANAKRLSYFKKMGSEWSKRVGFLVRIVQNREMTVLDKWVAYGALFYLITPFDLIPDHIPVIGLIDDFGILGFALAYYLRRFPHLVAE